MMEKVFKGLEINEKDNLWTAVAKVTVEGTLNCLAYGLLVGGTLYAIGKTRTK